jgi:hypothetical protein
MSTALSAGTSTGGEADICRTGDDVCPLAGLPRQAPPAGRTGTLIFVLTLGPGR